MDKPTKERDLIPLQPIPLVTKPSYYQVNGTVVTAIARMWAPGDAERCRLCDRCSASEGLCNLTVKGFIPRESCTFFSTLGRKRQRVSAEIGLIRRRGDYG